MLVVGSFQAWSEISGGGTTAALYGIPDRSLAWVTLGAGIAVLVLTFLVALTRGSARRAFAALAMVAALVGGAVGVYEAATAKNAVLDDFAEQLSDDYGGSPAEMRELLDQAVGAGQLVVSTGVGVYLAIAGGALGLVGSALAMRKSPAAPELPVGASMPADVPSAPTEGPGGEPEVLRPPTEGSSAEVAEGQPEAPPGGTEASPRSTGIPPAPTASAPPPAPVLPPAMPHPPAADGDDLDASEPSGAP
jgi:hypothetical protein